MGSLTRENCIFLARHISSFTLEDLNNYPHRLSAYRGYKVEVANSFLDVLGQAQTLEDVNLNLGYYEDNFSKLMFTCNNWALPGIAKLYLAMYKGNTDKFPIIQGRDLYKEYLCTEWRFNFITKPEGMHIWFKWMYALLAPEELSISLQKSLYTSIPTRSVVSVSKEKLLGSLTASLNAPYNPPDCKKEH